MKKSIAIFYFIAIARSAASAQEKKPPPPPPPVIEHAIAPSAAGPDTFYAQNPSVSKAWYKDRNVLIIELKNGKQESYNLDVKDQHRAFTEKYTGEPPVFPQPPPPPKKKQFS